MRKQRLREVKSLAQDCPASGSIIEIQTQLHSKPTFPPLACIAPTMIIGRSRNTLDIAGKHRTARFAWSKGTWRTASQNMVPNQGHQNLLQHLSTVLPLPIRLIKLCSYTWDLKRSEYPTCFLPALKFENLMRRSRGR